MFIFKINTISCVFFSQGASLWGLAQKNPHNPTLYYIILCHITIQTFTPHNPTHLYTHRVLVGVSCGLNNTLDFAHKVVCHETAGFIGCFLPWRVLPSIGCLPPRQRVPFGFPSQQGATRPYWKPRARGIAIPLES